MICQRTGDDAARSVILYIMSMVQSILYTFWGIALYPASDAPYWKKGYIAMIVVVFGFFGMTGAMQWVSSPLPTSKIELTDPMHSSTPDRSDSLPNQKKSQANVFT